MKTHSSHQWVGEISPSGWSCRRGGGHETQLDPSAVYHLLKVELPVCQVVPLIWYLNVQDEMIHYHECYLVVISKAISFRPEQATTCTDKWCAGKKRRIHSWHLSQFCNTTVTKLPTRQFFRTEMWRSTFRFIDANILSRKMFQLKFFFVNHKKQVVACAASV